VGDGTQPPSGLWRWAGLGAVPRQTALRAHWRCAESRAFVAKDLWRRLAGPLAGGTGGRPPAARRAGGGGDGAGAGGRSDGAGAGGRSAGVAGAGGRSGGRRAAGRRAAGLTALAAGRRGGRRRRRGGAGDGVAGRAAPTTGRRGGGTAGPPPQPSGRRTPRSAATNSVVPRVARSRSESAVLSELECPSRRAPHGESAACPPEIWPRRGNPPDRAVAGGRLASRRGCRITSHTGRRITGHTSRRIMGHTTGHITGPTGAASWATRAAASRGPRAAASWATRHAPSPPPPAGGDPCGHTAAPAAGAHAPQSGRGRAALQGPRS